MKLIRIDYFYRITVLSLIMCISLAMCDVKIFILTFLAKTMVLDCFSSEQSRIYTKSG